MKIWLRKAEWVDLAACLEDNRFIAERLCPADAQEVAQICSGCPVRAECMEWAVENQACSVVVAGIRLPDPSQKRTLRRVYKHFGRAIPAEKAERGDI